MHRVLLLASCSLLQIAKKVRKIGRPIKYIGRAVCLGLTASERSVIRHCGEISEKISGLLSTGCSQIICLVGYVDGTDKRMHSCIFNTHFLSGRTMSINQVHDFEKTNNKLKVDDVKLRNEMMELRHENMALRFSVSC